MSWFIILFLALSLFLKYSLHYSDVIMTTIASQITSLTIVYSAVYSGADQSKHQSSASLAFVCGPGTGQFPAQMASYAEDVPIWWRHHGFFKYSCTSIFHRHSLCTFYLYRIRLILSLHLTSRNVGLCVWKWMFTKTWISYSFDCITVKMNWLEN